MAIQTQGLLIISVKDVEPSHPTKSTYVIPNTMSMII